MKHGFNELNFVFIWFIFVYNKNNLFMIQQVLSKLLNLDIAIIKLIYQ